METNEKRNASVEPLVINIGQFDGADYTGTRITGQPSSAGDVTAEGN